MESLYKAENLAKHQGNFSQVYLDFWNHYNDTPEQKVYSDLMKKLAENEHSGKYLLFSYRFSNEELFRSEEKMGKILLKLGAKIPSIASRMANNETVDSILRAYTENSLGLLLI